MSLLCFRDTTIHAFLLALIVLALFEHECSNVLPFTFETGPPLENLVCFLPKPGRPPTLATFLADKCIVVWVTHPVPIIESNLATCSTFIFAARLNYFEGNIKRIVVCAHACQDCRSADRRGVMKGSLKAKRLCTTVGIVRVNRPGTLKTIIRTLDGVRLPTIAAGICARIRASLSFVSHVCIL